LRVEPRWLVRCLVVDAGASSAAARVPGRVAHGRSPLPTAGPRQVHGRKIWSKLPQNHQRSENADPRPRVAPVSRGGESHHSAIRIPDALSAAGNRGFSVRPGPSAPNRDRRSERGCPTGPCFAAARASAAGVARGGGARGKPLSRNQNSAAGHAVGATNGNAESKCHPRPGHWRQVTQGIGEGPQGGTPGQKARRTEDARRARPALREDEARFSWHRTTIPARAHHRASRDKTIGKTAGPRRSGIPRAHPG